VASKNIGIKEDVYERLKAHKRGDESFSETLDRLLHEFNSDWRTNVGFLTDEDAAEFERVVAQGLDDTDESLGDLADEIDERLQENS
jgi:predicted CopG family antitoxin